MRTVLSFIVVLLLAAVAFGQEDVSQEEALALANPGITPDSPLYFFDGIFEYSQDPERVLEYKEEKIAEAWTMAQEGKVGEAETALGHLSTHNNMLLKEISPEMEELIKQKIGLYQEALAQISTTTGLEVDVTQENKILLAAEVATKIKQLCGTLSQLDPAQYAVNCKAAIDSPEWQKEHDQQLTQEQKEHASVFAQKLKQCIQAPEQCDCTGTGVKSFEALCIQASAREAACRSGDLVACQGGGEVGLEELKGALPAYLFPALKDAMEEYQKGALAHHPMDENTLLQPCVDQGITGVEECRKYMEDNFVATYYKETTPPEGFEMAFETTDDFLAECSKRMSPEQCRQIQGQVSEKGAFAGQAVYPAYSYAGPTPVYQFDYDCSAIPDSAKARCFEEFNSAAQQVAEATLPPDFSIYAQKWQSAQSDEERWAIKEELRQAMIRQGYDSGSIQIQGDDGNFIVDYQDNGQTYRNEYSQGTVVYDGVVYDGYVPESGSMQESTAEQGSTESLPPTEEQTVESWQVAEQTQEGTETFPDGTISPREAWEQTNPGQPFPGVSSNDITGGVVGTQEDSFAWRVAGWVKKYMGI